MVSTTDESGSRLHSDRVNNERLKQAISRLEADSRMEATRREQLERVMNSIGNS